MNQVQEVFGNLCNMKKIEYIKKLEEGGETYSVINILSVPKEFEKSIDGLKTTLVYSESNADYKDGKIKYNEKIYKTAQGFYIYLSLGEGAHLGLAIYYKQEKLNEVTLFVGGLLKQFKNATVNV